MGKAVRQEGQGTKGAQHRGLTPTAGVHGCTFYGCQCTGASLHSSAALYSVPLMLVHAKWLMYFPIGIFLKNEIYFL